MKKMLIYAILIIVSAVTIAAFLTATNFTQLGVAILLYPFAVGFAFLAFPRQSQKRSSIQPLNGLQPQMEQIEAIDATKTESSFGIADIDKRMFLMMIGGTGLTLFLFSIFNKKAEGLFFKSTPVSSGTVSIQDTEGKKINPAQSQPTDGYTISEVDDNQITFCGFTNKDGAWFIMREDTETGSFRYTRGETNFPDNWANRENLKYDYFNNVF